MLSTSISTASTMISLTRSWTIYLIVKSKDEEKWGDYQTKRTIREIYDALAKSIRTGWSRQTRLDPLPAAPRFAYPPRRMTIEKEG